MGPTRQQLTGLAGEDQVAADFGRIGWEPLYSRYDYGTDRYVIARDDLGNWIDIVGVQTKTGKSYFRRSQRDESGKVTGWWWRDSDNKHFDYWTSHELPHLLVLHDEDERVSYWAHITADRVQSTGKGRKIFVPIDQKIDKQSLDSLRHAASERRPALVREEPAHSSDGDVPEDRRLRFALIAPRLVAPHAAAGRSLPIDPVEGLALLAEGRFLDFKRFSEEHQSVPDPDELSGSDDWMWRLVGATWEWATTDSCHSLRNVFDSAPGKGEMTASGVLLACALRRLECFDDALSVLESMTALDGQDQADLGWVLVQRARALADIGDTDGSRSDAIRARQCLAGSGDDLTASALMASAEWQVFATEARPVSSSDGSAGQAVDTEKRSADQLAARFKELMTVADNAVSSWRSQTVARALSSVTDKYYESWAEYQPNRLFSSGGSTAAMGLFAAELSADITGDHGTWKAMSSLAGRQRLMGASDSNDQIAEIIEGIDALRRSGSSRHIELALDHLNRRGPVEAMTKSVRKIPPVSKWTHTTVDGNLTMLKLAGDLMDEQSAAEMLVEVTRIACLADTHLVERTKPIFSVGPRALGAVERLLPAAPDSTHTEVAAMIVAQRDRMSDHPAFNLDGVFSQIRPSQVNVADRDALWEHSHQSEGRLGTAVLGWFVSDGNPEARSIAVDRAENGDHRAFDALGDITALDNGQAERLMARLEVLALDKLSSERDNQKSFGGFDAVDALSLFNLYFPEAARWDPIIEILCEPLVDAIHKRRACARIVARPERLPSITLDALAADIGAISATTTVWGESSQLGGMGTALAVSIGVVQGEAADLRVTRHVAGTPTERRDAAWLIGHGHCHRLQPTLAVLIGDDNHNVRATAAAAIGRLLAESPNDMIQQLAQATAETDGLLLPSALLAGMSHVEASLPATGTSVTQGLLQHPSAQVRRAARRVAR